MTTETMLEFYDFILKNQKKYDNAEVLNLIANKGNADFYDLCREFVKLAITSRRFRIKEDNMIHVLYAFSDIDALTQKVRNFISQNDINNAEDLLKMLKYRYKDAVTHDELNSNSGMISSENFDYSQRIGIYGHFYNFTEIVSWDEIERDILKKL